jgi:hypothetical protein
MAKTSFSASARDFKGSFDAACALSPTFDDGNRADPLKQLFGAPASVAVGPAPAPQTDEAQEAFRVAPDEIVAILASLDETGGTREIGDLARAIPACRRPISAILALVDAGRLAIDPLAPFDAQMQVTRIA